MGRALRVLFIDDSEEDVMLTLRELRRSGYDVASRHVCGAAQVREALHEPWDFVISDWSMPDSFTGLDAFHIMRELGLDLPFVIVSGTIGEDIAVDALKAGVHDFMTKGRYARLVPTIERELREFHVRRREREAAHALAAQREALERSERLLRDVLDAVPDGVVAVDASGTILIWNRALTSIVGPRPPTLDALARSLTFFDRDMATPVKDQELAIAGALRGIAVDRDEHFVHIAASDKRFWVNVSARPLRDRAGSVQGALAVVRDVTRERAAQEQLMVSDRMASVGMLAAGVAHELNNPLAAVLANLDLVHEIVTQPGGPQPEDLPELAEMLDDARGAGGRVRTIVKDLRLFSRHEDSADHAVDLARTLESTLRMAWNEIRHRARLVKELAPTPPVKGSDSRLGQVFLNLIVNAAQAIPEGQAQRHTIRIVTGVEPSGDVFVAISDTGHGMTVETQRRLFTPFFTTKAQGEGTGLGLAISHRIVTGLGGSIRVESAPGQGTTFRVVLPAAQDVTPVISRTPTMPPFARRARILVVDDEVMITTALRRILSGEHDVETTTDARSAVELVRAREFDLIFCDVMMPHMTGMEFYERVRADRRDQADRIVFMTGDAFTTSARAFLDEVPNERIEKPFEASVIRALITARTK